MGFVQYTHIPVCPRLTGPSTSVPTSHCAHIPVCPRLLGPTYHCVHIPLPTYQCAYVSLGPHTSVSTYHCAHIPVCPRLIGPVYLCPRLILPTYAGTIPFDHTVQTPVCRGFGSLPGSTEQPEYNQGVRLLRSKAIIIIMIMIMIMIMIIVITIKTCEAQFQSKTAISAVLSVHSDSERTGKGTYT